MGSNHRSPECRSGVVAAGLRDQYFNSVDPPGIEPAISTVAGSRALRAAPRGQGSLNDALSAHREPLCSTNSLPSRIAWLSEQRVREPRTQSVSFSRYRLLIALNDNRPPSMWLSISVRGRMTIPSRSLCVPGYFPSASANSDACE